MVHHPSSLQPLLQVTELLVARFKSNLQHLHQVFTTIHTTISTEETLLQCLKQNNSTIQQSILSPLPGLLHNQLPINLISCYSNFFSAQIDQKTQLLTDLLFQFHILQSLLSQYQQITFRVIEMSESITKLYSAAFHGTFLHTDRAIGFMIIFFDDILQLYAQHESFRCKMISQCINNVIQAYSIDSSSTVVSTLAQNLVESAEAPANNYTSSLASNPSQSSSITLHHHHHHHGLPTGSGSYQQFDETHFSHLSSLLAHSGLEQLDDSLFTALSLVPSLYQSSARLQATNQTSLQSLTPNPALNPPPFAFQPLPIMLSSVFKQILLFGLQQQPLDSFHHSHYIQYIAHDMLQNSNNTINDNTDLSNDHQHSHTSFTAEPSTKRSQASSSHTKTSIADSFQMFFPSAASASTPSSSTSKSSSLLAPHPATSPNHNNNNNNTNTNFNSPSSSSSSTSTPNAIAQFFQLQDSPQQHQSPMQMTEAALLADFEITNLTKDIYSNIYQLVDTVFQYVTNTPHSSMFTLFSQPSSNPANTPSTSSSTISVNGIDWVLKSQFPIPFCSPPPYFSPYYRISTTTAHVPSPLTSSSSQIEPNPVPKIHQGNIPLPYQPALMHSDTPLHFPPPPPPQQVITALALVLHHVIGLEPSIPHQSFLSLHQFITTSIAPYVNDTTAKLTHAKPHPLNPTVLPTLWLSYKYSLDYHLKFSTTNQVDPVVSLNHLPKDFLRNLPPNPISALLNSDSSVAYGHGYYLQTYLEQFFLHIHDLSAHKDDEQDDAFNFSNYDTNLPISDPLLSTTNLSSTHSPRKEQQSKVASRISKTSLPSNASQDYSLTTPSALSSNHDFDITHQYTLQQYSPQHDGIPDMFPIHSTQHLALTALLLFISISSYHRTLLARALSRLRAIPGFGSNMLIPTTPAAKSMVLLFETLIEHVHFSAEISVCSVSFMISQQLSVPLQTNPNKTKLITAAPTTASSTSPTSQQLPNAANPSTRSQTLPSNTTPQSQHAIVLKHNDPILSTVSLVDLMTYHPFLYDCRTFLWFVLESTVKGYDIRDQDYWAKSNQFYSHINYLHLAGRLVPSPLLRHPVVNAVTLFPLTDPDSTPSPSALNAIADDPGLPQVLMALSMAPDFRTFLHSVFHLPVKSIIHTLTLCLHAITTINQQNDREEEEEGEENSQNQDNSPSQEQNQTADSSPTFSLSPHQTSTFSPLKQYSQFPPLFYSPIPQQSPLHISLFSSLFSISSIILSFNQICSECHLAFGKMIFGLCRKIILEPYSAGTLASFCTSNQDDATIEEQHDILLTAETTSPILASIVEELQTQFETWEQSVTKLSTAAANKAAQQAALHPPPLQHLASLGSPSSLTTSFSSSSMSIFQSAKLPQSDCTCALRWTPTKLDDSLLFGLDPLFTNYRSSVSRATPVTGHVSDTASKPALIISTYLTYLVVLKALSTPLIVNTVVESPLIDSIRQNNPITATSVGFFDDKDCPEYCTIDFSATFPASPLSRARSSGVAPPFHSHLQFQQLQGVESSTSTSTSQTPSKPRQSFLNSSSPILDPSMPLRSSNESFSLSSQNPNTTLLFNRKDDLFDESDGEDQGSFPNPLSPRNVSSVYSPNVKRDGNSTREPTFIQNPFATPHRVVFEDEDDDEPDTPVKSVFTKNSSRHYHNTSHYSEHNSSTEAVTTSKPAITPATPATPSRIRQQASQSQTPQYSQNRRSLTFELSTFNNGQEPNSDSFDDGL